jgi:alpha-ketoglutarate-dependent taurine dioxygenase
MLAQKYNVDSDSSVFPCSFAQQRLWFLEQLHPTGGGYNIHLALRFHGKFDYGVLNRTLTEIFRRHDSLRTRFRLIDDKPVQVVGRPHVYTAPIIDLSALTEAQRRALTDRLSRNAAVSPFNLAEDILLRLSLLRLAEEEHVALFTIHHIIVDHWSMVIFIRELIAIYSAYSEGRPSPLPETDFQYADFAQRQQAQLQSEEMNAQLEYWRRQLAGPPARLRLPMQNEYPPIQTFRGKNHQAPLSRTMTRSLKELGYDEGATFFMVMLAAFKVLLYRYTNREDIIVGTDIANRNHLEIEEVIGFFVNQLALRADLSGNPSFRKILGRVREAALSAYSNQDLPFDRIVEELQPERSLSHPPIFQILFVVQNFQAPEFELPGLKVEIVQTEETASRYDLVVVVIEKGASAVVNFIYNTSLYSGKDIVKLAGHYQNLLEDIAAHPERRLLELEIYSAEEKLRIEAESRAERESKLLKLKSVKPSRMVLHQDEIVEAKALLPNEAGPLMMRPTVDEFDPVEWASHHRDLLEENLLRHGAILFRNFMVATVAQLEAFAQAICRELYGEYGDLPREQVGNKVYGSTPYPAHMPILLHNESSHMHCWPRKIWFYCMTPAEAGGETPIADCRKIYKSLNPALIRRFASKGLLYVRNYTDDLDLGWRQFFRTEDRTEVEEFCRRGGIAHEWISEQHLRTRKICPAVITHPLTGESVFFNQLQAHHIRCLDPDVRESLLSLFSEEDLPRNVYYGDGSPIEDSAVDEIRQIYDEFTISFPWREKDILMVDNMLTAHGRNPFTGERKIMVAMGEMIMGDKAASPAAPL